MCAFRAADVMDKHYDQAYFQRWYRREDIGGSARLARKVAMAVAMAEYYLERPIRSVLDVGCGEGAWRAPLLKLRHWLNPVRLVPGWQSASAPALLRAMALVELAVLVVIVISRGA